MCINGTLAPCVKDKPWTCPAGQPQATKDSACKAMIGNTSYCKANPDGTEYCQATFAEGNYSAPIPCCLRPR
jgi:hypothetical protein